MRKALLLIGRCLVALLLAIPATGFLGIPLVIVSWFAYAGVALALRGEPQHLGIGSIALLAYGATATVAVSINIVQFLREESGQEEGF